MILVTGATGRVGYRLMEALADAHADVTAMVRVEARADDLPGTPKHVVATFDDPPAEILRGFDRVFLLSPAIEEQAELETVFIDALVAAGHRPHVVKIAADGFADPGCEVRFMLSHRQVAAHLDATGLPATYLAPALYMEDLLALAGSMRESAEVSAPGRPRAGRVRRGQRRGHGRGPGAHQHRPRGRDLRADRTGGAAVQGRRGAGLGRLRAGGRLHRPAARTRARGHAGQRASPWQADGNLELFDWIREGGADTVTAAVRELTGAEPQPVQDWLEESRGSFEGPPLDPPASFF